MKVDWRKVGKGRGWAHFNHWVRKGVAAMRCLRRVAQCLVLIGSTLGGDREIGGFASASAL